MDWADCYPANAHFSRIEHGVCKICNTFARQVQCFYCGYLGYNVCQYDVDAYKNIEYCPFCKDYMNNFTTSCVYCPREKLAKAYTLRPETCDAAKKYLQKRLNSLHNELFVSRDGRFLTMQM